MINSVNASLNTNIPSKSSRNKNSYYLNSNSFDSVSFQGKNNILKEMFVPKYLKLDKTQSIADDFVEKLIGLYKKKNLNEKSVKKITKEVAPDSKIAIKNIDNLNAKVPNSNFHYKGFTVQRTFLNFKSTKIFVSFDSLNSADAEEKQEAAKVLAHEFTHAIRLQAKVEHTNHKKSHFDLKLQNMYLKSQEVLCILRYSDWSGKIFDNKKDETLRFFIDKILKDSSVNKKKDKISELRKLYFYSMSEAAAYKNESKICDALLNNNEKNKQYVVYEDFAEAIKNRYLEEGGDPSKLKF